MTNKNIKACLFDLDGVVFNTEPLYSIFWREQGQIYHPEVDELEKKIKGQTLKEIFDKFFSDVPDEQPKIVERLNEYERTMQYRYVPGLPSFVRDLIRRGVKTAIVTSSNIAKMNSVYQRHPELRELFDEILTADDFAASKPSPDCYLKAAARFGVAPEECVVYEDSFNGIKSGRASGAHVVGLATTNPKEALAPLCDEVIDDFKEYTL